MELEFDYVIIGAGSAGCVFAKRLSTNVKFRVLVFEAGGSDRRFWIQSPIGCGMTFCGESVNWKYTTEPVPGINIRCGYRYDSRLTGASLFPVIQVR